MNLSDLQGRQASLDDAGLAVLDDLVESLKVLIPQGEDHPAWVVVLPPQPHRLLTAGLHLSHKRQEKFITLFSDHNRSLLRQQPGACTCYTPNHIW